ncbi:hypothetical protein [Geminicoccus sp.]|jgi:hypothetical protein|uniref:hypothetical protein n=1 Tax=Geminicoccus sp. TaxID=2024832 RepID=UPI002E30393A|nr:hypothetical protein [Geminicoccus sp.]
MVALLRLELVRADGGDTGPFATWLAKERGWRMGVPFHRQHQAWRYESVGPPTGFHVLLGVPRRAADG